MVFSYRKLLLILAFGALIQATRGQSFSNAGKEFWIPFSYHYGMLDGSGEVSMSIYVSSDSATNFSVEVYGNTILQPTRPIAAGEIVKIDIPKTFYINGEGLFSKKVIKVVADDPVIVYSYITRAAQSAATVCLPVQVLGKEYFSMNFTQRSNSDFSNSYFTIIAVEEGITEVEITPASKTSSGKTAGLPYRVYLSKGDVYQVLGAIDNFKTNGFFNGSDMTGSKISSVSSGTNSCKRIAVFSGSGKITIGNGCGGTSDNLYQQLYPFNTWGNTFLAVPSYNRPWNYYRVIAKDPGTIVRINGAIQPPGMQAGSAYSSDFYFDRPVKIESENGSICVAQYFTTAGCPTQNLSPYDPDMIILNPVEQNIKYVNLVNARLFNTTVNYAHEHHLHVISANKGTALTSFKFDGQSVPSSYWKTHPQDGNYSYLYVDDFRKVTEGYHTLSSDSGFNALVYGFAEFESYGYSAGANVRDKYQYLSIQNDSAINKQELACTNRPFYFQITLPYEATKLSWDFEDPSLKDTIDIDPAKSLLNGGPVVVDNKMVYTYKLNKPYVIYTKGKYKLSVKIEMNNSIGCGGSEEANFEIEVREQPMIGAKKLKNCVSDPIEFTDNSKGNGSMLTRFFWNFGDGIESDQQNPVHKYADAQTFIVKHWVLNDIGCLSDTLPITTVVDPLPEAGLVVTAATCEKRILPLEDNSTANATDMSSFKWSLAPAGLTSTSQDPVFVVDTGNYTVELVVTNNNGCIDTVRQALRVSEVPKASFLPPKACLADPAAAFTNQTPPIVGSGLSYLWNFGDGGTSTDENPSHKYIINAADTFTAKLKVTDVNTGCDSTQALDVIINGVNPIASFKAITSCSNKDIIIQDSSYVADGGAVVRVKVDWDIADPTIDTIDNSPKIGSRYSHKYPPVVHPATQLTYNIRYIAFSGDVCRDTLNTILQVLASPAVQFDPLNGICQEKIDTLIEARDTTGIPGNGTFACPLCPNPSQSISTLSSTTGEFKPGIPGPGMHQIRYIYKALNSCADTAYQTIAVFPTPTNVSAGGDASGKVYTLEEDSVMLKGKATGIGLTYLWEPPISMNNYRLDTPKVSPSDDITYKFIAVSDKGCRASAYVTVVVLKKLIVPNVFTPNNDGFNDVWNVTPLNIYPGATIQVFTRYGQLVYRSNGYERPWDGTFNGRPLPVGTYYWVIDPKMRKAISGSVTIIR